MRELSNSDTEKDWIPDFVQEDSWDRIEILLEVIKLKPTNN